MEAESNNHKCCWDHWGCKEEEKAGCRACKRGLGKFCWYALPAFSPKKGREFRHCYNCEWYQKHNPRAASNPSPQPQAE